MPPKGPKEWQQGDLTEEELARISQPIGEAPGPDAPIEVEPEPEIIIEGEAAPEEPPIVVNLEEEPLVEPAPTETEAAHEKMVEGLLQLHTDIYKARYRQEPDEKFLQKMRALYGRQTEELLQKQTASLTQELQGAQGGKAA